MIQRVREYNTHVLGKKTSPSASLAITDLTGTSKQSNQGLSNDRLVTNRPSYHTALKPQVYFN